MIRSNEAIRRTWSWAQTMLFDGSRKWAMARCCNAAAGSSAPDTNIALTLVWQIAACAKAQPALYSFSVNVHSWRSPRHSSEVYATIYTGYGRHRCH